MEKPHKSIDPGLGEKYTGRTRNKSINANGTFNVKRIGAGTWVLDSYHFLINLSWKKFNTLVLAFYLSVNLLFAGIYLLIGAEHLAGARTDTIYNAFLSSFFFSVQTVTTVGYGSIAPTGLLSSLTAAVEALIGLMTFAIITGLIYARFSKPSAKIFFTRNVLVSPYKENGKALMFRIANMRKSELIDISANVILMMVDESSDTNFKRTYNELKLERDNIYFFPLNWTLVHPIDENSPLYGKDEAQLKKLDAEILVLIKAFDDTFSQTVHARYSYKHDEIVWDARYGQPFYVDDKGDLVMELDKLNNHEKLNRSEPGRSGL